MTNRPFKRAARVASEVYHVIANVLYNELSDPRLRGLQITGATMTDDLQIVKLYYYLGGDEKVRASCLKGLKKANGYLRKALSDKLNLRVTPEIRYYFDENIEKAERLDKLLDNLKDSGEMGVSEETD